MGTWIKANGGPLAVVVVGFGIGGFTNRLLGFVVLVIGVVWFLVDQIRHHPRVRRMLAHVPAAGASPSTLRDATADYEIAPGVVIPPDSEWEKLPHMRVPPSLGVARGGVLQSLEGVESPIPDGYPPLRVYASGGARLNAYAKVTQVEAAITNCGDRPVSLGLRLFQMLDGITPLVRDGLARSRVQLAPVIPEMEDRIAIGARGFEAVTRTYYWPLDDADLAAIKSGGFGGDLWLEIADHASTTSPILFQMGYWP